MKIYLALLLSFACLRSSYGSTWIKCANEGDCKNMAGSSQDGVCCKDPKPPASYTGTVPDHPVCVGDKATCEKFDGTVVCFSADQTVDVKKSTGEVITIRMDELKVGDNVRVGLQGEFSKVFAFSHKDHAAFTKMIRIETDFGHIKLSGGHYVYANGVRKLARNVEHGEMLHHRNGTLAAIKKIEGVMAHGVFAPHTVHGDIIVNGHKASCYTEAIKPEIAHAILKPFAFLFDQGFESAGKLAESLINVRSELAMKLLGSKE